MQGVKNQMTQVLDAMNLSTCNVGDDPPTHTRIVRMRVVLNGRRTSVSLDELLVTLLTLRLGGHEQLVQWATGVAEASLPLLHQTRQKHMGSIGLSRLVQRQAIKMVANPSLLEMIGGPGNSNEVKS